MSITPDKDPALSPKKTPPAKLAAAVGILVVALVVLFFVVLKPMFFPSEDEFAYSPAAQEGAPAPPGAPPAPAPDEPPAASGNGVPAPATPTSLTPLEGEIVVYGAISEIRPDGSLMVRTSRVNLYQQGEIQLEPARLKEVKLAPGGMVTQAGSPTTSEAFGIGLNISAVGPNLGEGKVLTAREIAL